MKKLLLSFCCIGVCVAAQAQVNFVKNPGLEEYSKCPTGWNEINYALYWSSITDSLGEPYCAPEYINTCGDATRGLSSAPLNACFFQYPRGGQGMAQVWMYADAKYRPGDGLYRDYLQGRLLQHLSPGIEYCVKMYVNLEEASQYAINDIGAYLDDGSVNGIASCGSVITRVIPQLVSAAVIDDTIGWTKIEGSFKADGTERFITIGNFYKTADVVTKKMPATWLGENHHSLYLIDDVSIIPLDLPAEAGADTWVGKGDSVQVGRVGDTTAIGLDCKWYHKGSLIDSGAAIWVKGYGLVGDKDTYTVVQTICGLVKTDTVVVYTVPTGMHEIPKEQQFNIFPNPCNGTVTISNNAASNALMHAQVYDLSGRLILDLPLSFRDNMATLTLDAVPGLYVLALSDSTGRLQRMPITIYRER